MGAEWIHDSEIATVRNRVSLLRERHVRPETDAGTELDMISIFAIVVSG